MEVQKFISNNTENKLKNGDIVEGTVKNIQHYGAFIQLENNIIGLLHIEDISIARISTPAERLNIGQKIKVKIKNIDYSNNKIDLSYKEMFGTWQENAQQFTEGTIVQGIIRETEKHKNGIFIELKPNLVGMAEYKDGFEYGQNVNVYVKKIINDKQKIKLIIK